MKQIVLNGEQLSVGDHVADLIVEYSGLLSRVDGTDSITFNARTGDGKLVTGRFQIGAGFPVFAGISDSVFAEPPNDGARASLNRRIANLHTSNAGRLPAR